jgi:hypothetical protein
VRSFSWHPNLYYDSQMFLPNHSLTPYPKTTPLPYSPCRHSNTNKQTTSITNI